MYRKTRRLRRNKRRSTKRRAHRTKKMRGGSCGMSRQMGMHTIDVLPSAIGLPYNAADLVPKGTHYAYNPNVEQWPDQSNALFNMNGGKRTRYRKGKKTQYYKKGKKTQYGKTQYGKRQRGGSFSETVSNMFTNLLPEEVVNITRSLPAGVSHMYDRYNGAIPSASSMVYPTEQPLVKAIYANPGSAPSDISSIYNAKNALVSAI